MTSLDPTKMKTQRVKSPVNDSQVLGSPRPQKTSGPRQSGVRGGRYVKKNLLTLSSTGPHPTRPEFKSSKKVTPKKSSKNNHKIRDSLSPQSFLKTPVKLDMKIPAKHLFFQNFLKTKGHLGSPKWTKDMTNSLEGIRQGFAVFDAKTTKIACARAFHFLKTYQKPLEQVHNSTVKEISSDFQDSKSKVQTKKKKLDILFVNTSEQYRHLIQKVARITHQRYIHEKWVGGTLTNWSQISQSYSLFGRFHSLFGNFLKKRKIHLPLYEKARRNYSGLLPQETKKKKGKVIESENDSKISEPLDHHHVTNLEEIQNSSDETFDHPGESTQGPQMATTWSDGLPDVVFLINPEENQNVLREANLLKIPVIALTDSHTKISGIDYMIPGNVQSIHFVYWFLNCMTIILQKRNKPKKKKSKTLSSSLKGSGTE